MLLEAASAKLWRPVGFNARCLRARFDLVALCVAVLSFKCVNAKFPQDGIGFSWGLL